MGVGDVVGLRSLPPNNRDPKSISPRPREAPTGTGVHSAVRASKAGFALKMGRWCLPV